MIITQFTIPFELCDLNTYINAERTNRFKEAKIKKEQTESIAWITKQLTKVDVPFKLKVVWYVKNKKKDPDNVAFAKKFILDGMKEGGMIENDGMAQVVGFEDVFIVTSEPKVTVFLYSNE